MKTQYQSFWILLAPFLGLCSGSRESAEASRRWSGNCAIIWACLHLLRGLSAPLVLSCMSTWHLLSRPSVPLLPQHSQGVGFFLCLPFPPSFPPSFTSYRVSLSPYLSEVVTGGMLGGQWRPCPAPHTTKPSVTGSPRKAEPQGWRGHKVALYQRSSLSTHSSIPLQNRSHK